MVAGSTLYKPTSNSRTASSHCKCVGLQYSSHFLDTFATRPFHIPHVATAAARLGKPMTSTNGCHGFVPPKPMRVQDADTTRLSRTGIRPRRCYVCTTRVYMRMHTYTYVRACKEMRAYAQRVRVHIRVHMCTCPRAAMCACACACVHTCEHACVRNTTSHE